MATSPIYSWPEPDNTDLVKNGALAIRTLGNAIDTTMATMVPKTIVDAKGDLIAGTAADTAARLAVGNNGETLVADSSTSTGLRWQGHIEAGKNFIINGGFDIWQRGTSSTASATYATADRWYQLIESGSGTWAQETTVVPTGATYSLKFTASATSSIYPIQAIESLNARRLAGKTVTFSGEVAASTSTAMSMIVSWSATADLAPGASWTNLTATSGGTATPTSTTFVPISGTFDIPSTAKSIRVIIRTTSTIANGVVVYWGNQQLEVGSVATTFSRAGGTIQGELAACQRYFQKTNNQSETPGTAPTSTPINAINASTTIVVGVPPFKVSMRVAPTVTLYSSVTGTTGRIRSGGADVVASVADVGEYTIGYISATGLTAGSNSTIAFAASAEL